MKEQTQTLKVTHKGLGHRQRLRERFLNAGLAGFHDYEVVELLLSLNTPRKDCKASAKKLVERFGSLPAIFEADPANLCQVEGIGPVNSLGIRLIKAVADRYLEQKIRTKDVVSNPSDLKEFLTQTMGHRNREAFAAIYLDAKNRVLTSQILFSGTLTASSVYPRELVISALEHNAASVIFAHNHPSGDVEPSQADIRITRRLVFAMRTVDIIVHEHMIVGCQEYYSFAENGLIKEFDQAFEEQHS